MKVIKIIISIFLFQLFSSALIGQREVYWLHGINGNTSHYDRYSNYYQANRSMDCSTVGFNSQGTVDDITNTTSSSITPQSDNIVIGHSLGGIVARNYEIEGPSNEAGGVITVHCPNQGASIAAAVRSGEADALLTQIRRRVGNGLREVDEHLGFYINSWNFLISVDNVMRNVLDPFYDDVNRLDWRGYFNLGEIDIPNSGDVNDDITSAFNIISDPDLVEIIDDLTPGSPFMDKLNGFPSTLPRIEIQGWEDDPEVYRLMCSEFSECWNDPINSCPDGDQCDLLDDLDEAIDGLRTASDILRGRAWLANPFTGKRGRLHEAARRTASAANYLESEFIDAWNDLVGMQYEVVIESRYTLTEDCEDQILALNQHIWELEAQRDDCYYESYPCPPGLEDEMKQLIAELETIENDETCYGWRYFEIFVPLADNSDALSDGFILFSEQVSGQLGSDDVYENQHINHLEPLNHRTMTDNFDDIWDRDPLDFFHTPR